MRFRITLTLLLLLPFAMPAAAAETPARLEAVEVVATPLIEGNRVTDYASEVTVVTGKQIENSGTLDLPSALRRVPGVNISRYNLIGSYGGAEGGAVYIRSNPRYPTATPDEVGNNLLLNAKLSYRLTPTDSRVRTTVFLSAENLTNRRYEYLPGYPAPGVTVMGGLHVDM